MGTLWNLQCRLLVAIQNNDEQQVSLLLEQGVDSDIRFLTGAQKRPAICLCTERGNPNMVELLVKWGCSINQSDSLGFTPLHIAVNHGHTHLVHLLLKNRANVRAVTSLGYTPLHLAAQRLSVEIIEMLLGAGSELERADREGKTALVHACIHGNSEIIQYLVSLRANVNACDIFGNSPLMFVTSAMSINLDVVQTLVNHGAHVNHANRSGETALHAAITGRRARKSEVLRILIRNNCNLDIRTGLGHTALHLAVLEHEDVLVDTLIRAGCKLNTQDELGLTPLFHLARDGNWKMLMLMISNGASLKQESWLKDPKLVQEIKDKAILNYLYEQTSQCAELKILCRLALRKHYDRYADTVFATLELPASIRDYLSLNNL